MRYMVTLRSSATRELDNLPERVANRILAKLLSLEDEPRPAGCKKLKGKEAYRIRIGEYRVIYQVNDKSKEVDVESVGHRKDVYK